MDILLDNPVTKALSIPYNAIKEQFFPEKSESRVFHIIYLILALLLVASAITMTVLYFTSRESKLYVNAQRSLLLTVVALGVFLIATVVYHTVLSKPAKSAKSE
jgi:hypothetical protein